MSKLSIIERNKKRIKLYERFKARHDKLLKMANNKRLSADEQFQARLKIQDDDEITRASKLGIKDFDKKYYLNDLVKGDVIFCSSGVTDGELVSGVKIKDKEYETETFALHYSQKFFKKVKKKYKI